MPNGGNTVDGFKRIELGPNVGGVSHGTVENGLPAVFIRQDRLSQELKDGDIIITFVTMEQAAFVARVIAGEITERDFMSARTLGEIATKSAGKIEPFDPEKPFADLVAQRKTELDAHIHAASLDAVASHHFDLNQASVGGRLDDVARWLRNTFPRT